MLHLFGQVEQVPEAEIVEQVAERRVRGITEGIYRASATAYRLSPRIAGRLGLRNPADELSLGYLLDLAEQVQHDIAGLDRSAAALPSAGISGEIRLRPDQRQEFLADLRSTLADLLGRYGGAEGETFRLALACYPHPDDQQGDDDDR